jgi:6-phosphogluconate dehydrogenase
MRIGFIGLGRMGANMVRRLLRDGHEIVAYNRTPEKTKEIATEGAEAAFTIAELVSKLEKPRAVWIMVPAGDATEAQIEELLEHLEPGDTIIDGGNTNFHDDVRRQAALKDKGIGYVDAGTSGGIWGLQVGYCLMVGGEEQFVKPLEPVFLSLLELAASAFKTQGQDLPHLKGWVADSGEGRWTVQEAIDKDVPAPIITLSLQTRFRSRQDDSYGAKVLAALRNEFGGHAVKTE